MKRTFVLFALVLCVAGTALADHDVEKAIRANDDLIEAAVKAGNAAEATAMYADDAVAMPPNMPALKGREGLKEFWKSAFAMGKTEIDLMIDDVKVSGDLAIERGRWMFTLTPSGAAPVKDNGKYLVVWRNRGGKWQIVDDIWNSDLAPMK